MDGVSVRCRFPSGSNSDDWGYPIIDPTPIEAHLLSHARRCVSSCPVLALRLERVRHGVSGRASREAPSGKLIADSEATTGGCIDSDLAAVSRD